jgi:hypothetical protein
MSEQDLERVGVAVCGHSDRCVLCGEPMAQGEPGLSLHVRAPEGGWYGYVCCMRCAALGPGHAAIRGSMRVWALRFEAGNIERLCESLPSLQGWPSADEIELYIAELDAERRAGVLAEAIGEGDVPF